LVDRSRKPAGGFDADLIGNECNYQRHADGARGLHIHGQRNGRKFAIRDAELQRTDLGDFVTELHSFGWSGGGGSRLHGFVHGNRRNRPLQLVDQSRNIAGGLEADCIRCRRHYQWHTDSSWKL
jgi:hypothetical protein